MCASKRSKLALARTNYSRVYEVYDGGKTLVTRDVLIPYNLLHLAAYVRQWNVEVAVFDAEATLLDERQLARTIAEWAPDVVGLTATTPDIDAVLKVCGMLKAQDRRIVTVVGGVHASVLPHEVAADLHVDHVVVGDGEEALREIVENVGRGGARSTGVPADKIVRGERLDLSELPIPAHDLLDYALYPFTEPSRGRQRAASIMTARGCPHRCTFCYHDRHVRCRPVPLVLAEIEHLYAQASVRYFYIYDDTFLADERRAIDILRRIEELQLKDASFQFLTRGNTIASQSGDLLEAMCRAGVARVSLGVESGSPAMLKRIAKDVTREDFVIACRILLKHGIEPRASFMLGLPYETPATISETIAFALDLELRAASFNILTPYPGTAVYEAARAGKGLRFAASGSARAWQGFRRWGHAITETDAISAPELDAFRDSAIVAFYARPHILDYYQSLFVAGNRSRYFYRPLNHAWERRHGQPIPFWNDLDEEQLLSPP
jgi:anaerobic magnesium-protoporphyrin IX monomethyl ester cyclase